MNPERDFSFDPEQHIFTPRPDIKLVFGCKEHIDLIRPFSNYVWTEENVSVLLQENGLYLYKASVQKLCQWLRLGNLELRVRTSSFFGPGEGRIYGPEPSLRNGITKRRVLIGVGADEELAVDLEIKQAQWEKMNKKKRDGTFSTAEILTMNHVFFHELRHLNDPDLDHAYEPEAEDFALERTKRIVKGDLKLAAIWSLSADQLLS